MTMDKTLVLVTGASGFIAKHCIAELAKAGYSVRGTVRDLASADQVREALARAGADASRVSFAAADLTRDEGWDAAVAGCAYVLHVASPFPMEQPRDREDLVRPARDGALRVLRAAARAGVRRVVLTSSAVAIMYPAGRAPGHIYTEADWTDAGRRDITPYIASKTLAEQAAWAFARETPGAPELTVINPAFVQGPALDSDLSTSHEVLRLMARGLYPAAPRIEFPVTDARDVAALHVTAMTHPKAAGERFLSANGSLRLIAFGRLMVEECPDLASKAPRFELPDFAVRGLALFDRRLRSILPELGHARFCSNAKARDVLGHTFVPAEDAVRAAARSLRELGVI